MLLHAAGGDLAIDAPRSRARKLFEGLEALMPLDATSPSAPTCDTEEPVRSVIGRRASSGGFPSPSPTELVRVDALPMEGA